MIFFIEIRTNNLLRDSSTYLHQKYNQSPIRLYNTDYLTHSLVILNIEITINTYTFENSTIALPKWSITYLVGIWFRKINFAILKYFFPFHVRV